MRKTQITLFLLLVSLTLSAQNIFRTTCNGNLDRLDSMLIDQDTKVQGAFVEALPDGRIAVRVGNTVFKGYPVAKAA